MTNAGPLFPVPVAAVVNEKVYGSASDYVFSFTTGSTADTTQPTVTSSNANNYSVSITFSKGMQFAGDPDVFIALPLMSFTRLLTVIL